MRTKLLLVSLGVLLLSALSAEAALYKSDVRRSLLLQYENTSPRVERRPAAGVGRVLVDNDGGSNAPLLRRLEVFVGGPSISGSTTDVPSLSGFIWFRQQSVEGPASVQDGTGDVTSTIDWGNVSGWTISGGTFCNSVPATICDLASVQDDETVPEMIQSSNYNFDSWVFHGTGFTQPGGFLHRSSTTDAGNLFWYLRGEIDPGGEVPALPLIAIGAVGLSVVSVGIASLRRRN